MKKLIACILAAVLLLGAIPAAGAAFSDADKIAENKKTAVDYVSEKKIISGFPDGTFKPDDPMTRAQFAKTAVTALGSAVIMGIGGSTGMVNISRPSSRPQRVQYTASS